MRRTTKKRTRTEVKEEGDISADEYEPKPKRRPGNPKEYKKLTSNFKIIKNSNMEIDVENNRISTEECIELPPEILVQIFGSLPRKDLTSASKVNRHWELCSKDESLFWQPIWKVKLREDKGGYEYASYWPPTQKFTKQFASKIYPIIKLILSYLLIIIGLTTAKAARAFHFGEEAVNALPTQAEIIDGGTLTGLNTTYSNDVTMFCVVSKDHP